MTIGFKLILCSSTPVFILSFSLVIHVRNHGISVFISNLTRTWSLLFEALVMHFKTVLCTVIKHMS